MIDFEDHHLPRGTSSSRTHSRSDSIRATESFLIREDLQLADLLHTQNLESLHRGTRLHRNIPGSHQGTVHKLLPNQGTDPGDRKNPEARSVTSVA